MQLQPQLFNLNGLLNGRLFRIPEYQRAYSWETKQRFDLFNDIERVKLTGEDHFMATVVGLKKEQRTIVADEFAVFDIVDGQQRLTTLCILLKAIQSALDQNDKTEKQLSDELNKLLVKGDDLSLLLLQTNHDTSDIFANYLREGESTEEAVTSADQNLINAIKDCENFVEGWKKGGTSLVDLIAIIRNKLWAIFHSVDDEGLVYRVFEVLNSRGLDVDATDKLKSQLMGLMFENNSSSSRNTTIQELHLIWQDIYRTIGKQKYLTAETLRFAATLKAKTAPSRPLDEMTSVQRLVEIAGKKPRDIVDCAKWLQSVVGAADKLLANYRWRAVTQILQARLVAIAILLRKFPKATQADILTLWECISFRIYGLGWDNARIKVGDYTRLAWSITNENLSPEEIKSRLKEIGKGHSIDSVIKEFDPSNCYEGWTEELRYFFYRYDEHLSRKAGEKINEVQWAKIWAEEPAKSIEHIKPQSSGISYIHHLGNLILLPPGLNSKLKDKEPSIKVKSYKTSGMMSSAEVAKQIKNGKWGKEQVSKRAQKLLAWARNEWSD